MTLAQLRGHAARLVATCLAIVIAVAFVVATLVLNHTATTSVLNAVAQQYDGIVIVPIFDGTERAINEATDRNLTRAFDAARR